MANGDSNNWYARLTVLLVLAIIGWCVMVVATGSQKVQANTTKIAVQEVVIQEVRDDVKEIKQDVKTLLGR